MPESDRPEPALPETGLPESDRRPEAASLRVAATTAVPISPRAAEEPRSFRAEAAYTFYEEHRAPPRRDEDQVSRR